MRGNPRLIWNELSNIHDGTLCLQHIPITERLANSRVLWHIPVYLAMLTVHILSYLTVAQMSELGKHAASLHLVHQKLLLRAQACCNILQQSTWLS